MVVMDIKELTEKLNDQVIELKKILDDLQKDSDYQRKIHILNQLPIVINFLSQAGPIQTFLKNLSGKSEYAIKAVIAIGQAPIVFNIQNLDKHLRRQLITLLEHLLELEVFYNHLGGIIGYHCTVLSLILEHLETPQPESSHHDYIHPEGLNLNEDSLEVRQTVRWGIQHLPHIGMIYPLGGAGDRLNLKEEETGNPLPAALLPFLGRTLLEGLIRDLQAHEYLAFKLLGKQYLTPIAIMTSVEKDNHVHVHNICKSLDWFGRPSDSFHFFIQPLVPTITIEGNWSLSAPLNLTLKPCGHGVLWKLAQEQEVFKWFERHGRNQCIIRQINNPIAGIDQGILALTGLGCQRHKSFGFLSCERLLNSEEGTNVLIELEKNNGFDYCLTNIEYTQFTQKGIEEVPAIPGSHFSTYPTNTNILFVNLSTIRKILKICPIPGQIVNMKSEVPYIDSKGHFSKIPGGRLECTMQNAADYIVDHFSHRLSKKDCKNLLSTFILYNERIKTISTTKKSYKIGESSYSTPEQAFYDLLTNNFSLLKLCGYEMPPLNPIEDYLLRGPSFIFIFHPALGPLYSIIVQKIRKGCLKEGAELQLEIAETDIENLSLEGSLIVSSPSPLGILDDSGYLRYGQECKCTLKNISIRNQGIDRKQTDQYWKNNFVRKESVEIILGEGAEFYAEDLLLEGSHRFEVPSHHRLVLRPREKGKWKEELIPIDQPTWSWQYAFDSENAIVLNMSKN